MRKPSFVVTCAIGLLALGFTASTTTATTPLPLPPKNAPAGYPTNHTIATVQSLLGGIPQNGDTLGRPRAPVTLQYFGDLECPICKAFDLGALPGLVRRYVRTGKLKIEYRSLETATREPEVFRTQQIAALAAGGQKKMWYFIELFYHEQGEEDSGYVTESYLQALASQVPGLDLPAWNAARNDPALANLLSGDEQSANRARFDGTPAFLIGKTGGRLRKLGSVVSLTESSSFDPAINKLLS